MDEIRRQLRALREAQMGSDGRELSQEELGRRCGHDQRWISYRESEGEHKVKLTIEDARTIARALGYDAEFLIVEPNVIGRIQTAAANVPPGELAQVADLLEALPNMHDETRRAILAMLGSASVAAREAASR